MQITLIPPPSQTKKGGEVQFFPRDIRDTAERVFTPLDRARYAALFFVCGLFVLYVGYLVSLKVIFGLATIAFIVMLFFQLFITSIKGDKSGLITFEDNELSSIDENELLTISAIVPLFHEKEIVIRNLLKSLDAQWYPKEKIQVILVLEQGDHETLYAVDCIRDSGSFPEFVEIFFASLLPPQTKPKACLEALLECVTGELTVVFDAEDEVEFDQFRKANLAFRKSESRVACIQAKLEYRNPSTNFLTRLFAAEYATYFNLVLPGLSKRNLPVPLGGTSNYFRTEVLLLIGAWDVHNVTEDIDLGMWLARFGYHVRVMDSVTWEEANSRLKNFLKQRSRWYKGRRKVYIVHMRQPIRLFRELGLKSFLAFQIMIGLAPIMILISPFFWGLTVTYIVTRSVTIQALYPAVVLYLGVLSMTLGNGASVYNLMTGVMERRLYPIMIWVVGFSWIYFAIISVAALYGEFQLHFQPSKWEKTEHGLDMSDERVHDPRLFPISQEGD